jgi:ATP/ADP translocase
MVFGNLFSQKNRKIEFKIWFYRLYEMEMTPFNTMFLCVVCVCLIYTHTVVLRDDVYSINVHDDS